MNDQQPSSTIPSPEKVSRSVISPPSDVDIMMTATNAPPPSNKAAAVAGNNNDNTNNDITGMNGLLAERMAEGGGALCNDRNGQCLGSRGNIDASQAGIYTSIAKLASMLDSGSNVGSDQQQLEVPLVTIQTEKAALLVKEYGGRTVVFRVPAESAINNNETTVGGGGEQVVAGGDAGKAI
eukprot:CAMPEP_0201643460 /NCGR_PEP_ID=MMETSP0493-20130528/28239_1 /ASSEMBLY_ACC=CAM_ASM_000838 /TAXON_ID=420259 /ORGANISM="Thalassiosira gravida, Strain GMp14c1" /LENGTH=180 /DNA_ID=CAMNT_0048117883 /DNA_START=28 /DNA_END=570 /DNA_ORIENTATION=-